VCCLSALRNDAKVLGPLEVRRLPPRIVAILETKRAKNREMATLQGYRQCRHTVVSHMFTRKARLLCDLFADNERVNKGGR